jgi:hypothetical protein
VAERANAEKSVPSGSACWRIRLRGALTVGLFFAVWVMQGGPALGQDAQENRNLREQMEQMEKRHQAERDEMKRRIEQLEKTSGGPPPAAPASSLTSFRARIRKPEELRPYSPVVCPGFMECLPEPQLQLDAPTPAKEPGWELELQAYTRFRFNLYDNFSDTRNEPGAPTGTFVNSSSCSFNTSCKDDQRLRFSTMRGYGTAAIKNGPFMGVLSMDFAGDQFNDGVLLGNDSGPLGAAGQRQWVVNAQLYYLQYDGWAQLRLGRLYNHVGNGIIGHIPRDSIMATKSWTDQFSTRLTYVYGSTGRSIPNQPGNTGINETTQNKVEDVSGAEENLEGLMLIFNYTPTPMNRLQFFVWRMWDTTANGQNKQNQYIDFNGSGRLGRLDYAFELAYLGGTTPVISGAAGGAPGTRDEHRAYLAYLDLRYTLPPEILRVEREDLLSLGMTFGYGSGDNKPNDGKNTNFDQLFIDETVFRFNFLYSDDINGYDGRSFDTRRGSGFTNTTFIQPYAVFRPTEKLQMKAAWTYLRASVAQPAGTGVLGPLPVLNAALAYNCLGTSPPVCTSPVGGPTKDIGQEVDVLTDYFFTPSVRVFSYFSMFFPGRIYAPFADNALKYEFGIEYRF